MSRLETILSKAVKNGTMSAIEAKALHACASATFRAIRHDEAKDFDTRWGVDSAEVVKALFNNDFPIN